MANPTFDAGLFIALNLMGFAFMFFGFKSFGILHLVGIIIFLSLSLIMLSDYDVTYYLKVQDSTGVSMNQTAYIIGNGDINHNDKTSSWIGWVYLVLAFVEVYFFYTDWKGGGF
jgi:hypothetical protein